MMKPMLGALAALVLTGAAQAGEQASNCNRACLQGMTTAYLNALVKHDPSGAPFAKDVRFTENTKDLKLGEGLWTKAGPVSAYRQDYLDTRAGIAGSHVVMQADGKTVLLATRLKVVGRKITEVETQVSDNPRNGAFPMEHLTTVHPLITYKIKPSERNSRAELIRISDAYPAGLKAGSFVKVDAQMAPSAYRIENGMMLAGPPCTMRDTCKDMKTQPLGAGRTHFQDRVMAVDEEAGIVWRRMSWLPPGGSNERLVAFEIFKIWGGKMQAVEAFLRTEPLSSTSGWGA